MKFPAVLSILIFVVCPFVCAGDVVLPQGAGTLHFYRTTGGGLAARVVPQGVSVLQSVGGRVGVAPVAAVALQPRPATPKTVAVAPRPVPTAQIIRPNTSAPMAAPRPFGWPAYRNPLDRRPRP